MPKARLFTSSVSIVSHLLAKGEFLTATSELIAESLGLKVLAIDLRLGSWPAVIITLKNRALSRVAERFIEYSHRVVESLVR